MKKALLLSMLFMLTLFQVALAQTRTISGRVNDQQSGDGIPGVTVLLKGTTTGVSTGADGSYSLGVPAAGGVLVFSSVGYITQQRNIGTDNVINLGLKADATALNEVVVTGYGTQERRDLTGSIAEIKGAAIENLATPSFAQQLGGRAAGVAVQTPSALLGQTPRIQIRGVNSITGNNYPLVVVDGQPIFTGSNSGIDANASSGLADINPNDIESFEVLKDGSATAIYGSRGANGVILITTKRGRKGTPRVTYDNYVGFANTLKRYSVLGAADFIAISNEKDRNAGGAGTVAQPYLDANGNPVSTDWQDQVFRTGIQQNHAISVSGASDKTSFFFSGGYTDQKGVIRPNTLQRFTFRANVDSDIKSWLRVGLNAGLTRTQTIGLNSSTNGLSGNVAAALSLFPNVPVRNPDGSLYSNAAGALGRGNNQADIAFSYPNVLFGIENNIYRSTSYRVLGNGYIEVEPLKDLRLRSQLSTDTQLEDDFLYYDPRAGDGRGTGGYAYQNFAPNIRWNFQNTATYNHIFNDVHKVNAVVGVEYQSTTASYYSAAVQGFSDRVLDVNNIVSGSFNTAAQTVGGDYGQNGFQSYFGRLNYAFMDKYLISGTLRSDALSSLAPGHQRGWFPGGSIGWRLSQENFYKNSGAARIVSDIKLRASYARVGNPPPGYFPYAGLYGPVTYGSQSGLTYTNFGNGDLRWETAKKQDVGIDLAFLGGRITASVDYYRNFNDDQILQVPVSPSLGVPASSYLANVGSMWNKGLEVVINSENIRSTNFTWTTSFNFSTNVNQVTSLADGVTSLPGSYLGSQYAITQPGLPIASLYGYDYQGVNRANGNPIYKKIDGTLIQGNIASGTYFGYDPANPGTLGAASALTVADKIILGQTNPKIYGGLNNTFNFLGFDLNVFFRYNVGNSIMNITRQQLLRMDFLNNGTEILGRWQSTDNPGDGVTPKIVAGKGDFINNTNNSLSRFVEKGDFVRLQNVVLGYSLPTRVTSAIKITRLRVFAQVQNVVTFTKYSGVDPEVNTTFTSNLAPGLDYNSNPQQRVYTGGVNLTF